MVVHVHHNEKESPKSMMCGEESGGANDHHLKFEVLLEFKNKGMWVSFKSREVHSEKRVHWESSFRHRYYFIKHGATRTYGY